jgi:pantoate--beta-alanine ligase
MRFKMQVFADPHLLQTALRREYCAGRSIGFVPTMGALHVGHATLMARASAENPVAVASIFVNPTQFGPKEDLDKYPRTLEADLAICEAQGITHVLVPPIEAIYPEGRATYEVQMGLRSLDKVLCGASRPGHFNGVLQVVAKLFHLVQPQRAYFGKKDYQQFCILRTMAEELFFPVEVVPCDIVREQDGLAMSSRNRYLNAEERAQALFLTTTLQACRDMARPGLAVADLHARMRDILAAYPLVRLDYFDVRSGHNLAATTTLLPEEAPRAFVAAFCGTTRLIDNLELF